MNKQLKFNNSISEYLLKKTINWCGHKKTSHKNSQKNKTLFFSLVYWGDVEILCKWKFCLISPLVFCKLMTFWEPVLTEGKF